MLLSRFVKKDELYNKSTAIPHQIVQVEFGLKEGEGPETVSHQTEIFIQQSTVYASRLTLLHHWQPLD